MIIDTHAHYDDEQFNEDREELLKDLPELGVEAVINVGASLRGCKASLEFAKKYPYFYASVGVHPDACGELNEETFAELEKWCQQEKVVAIGEIGLDYHWDVEPREVQKKWFIRQIELARKLNLPINVHSRDAAEDTFNVIKEHAQGLKGIIHCFSGSKELALEYVKLGFHIGVGGVVTFKNGKKMKQVVEALPLEWIVLETDCPYLAPVPFRAKRNDSSKLSYVVEELAAIKQVPVEEVIRITNENGRRLYNI